MEDDNITARKPPQVTLAKLSPPLPAPNEILRERLDSLFFDSGIAPYTIVSAPAGYGKTTALAQWHRRAAALGFAVAWLSLDEDHANPRQFMRYLGSAMGPESGLGKPPEFAATADLADKALKSLLTWVDLSQRKTVLFLDDVQRAQSHATARIIAEMIKRAPRNLHIVLSGRGEPPVPLSGFRFRGQLREIGLTDLMFRHDEANAYFNGRIAKKEIDALLDRAEGWPIALQLMWLRLQERSGIRDLQHVSGRSSTLASYLVEQVFSELTSEVQLFLMSTCILERVDAGSAGALTGRDDARELLEYVESKNLFLIQLDQDRGWYRYHQLFAEFLRDRLTRHSPELEDCLHKKAAKWFFQQDQVRDSIQHALAVSDDRFVAQFIDCHGGMELALRCGTAALRGIEKVQSEVMLEYPAFGLAQAYCLIQNKQFRSSKAILELIDKSSNGFENLSLSHALQAKTIELLLAVYLDKPIPTETVSDLEQALEISPELIPDLLRTAILTIICCSHYGLDHHMQCRGWGEQGLLDCKNSGAAYAENYCRFFVGMSASVQGMLNESEKRFVEALRHAEALLGTNSNQAAIARILLAEVRYEQNELDEASSIFAELPVPEDLTDTWFSIYLSLFRTKASLFARTRSVGACLSVIEEGSETARQLRLPRLYTSMEVHKVRELSRAGRKKEALAASANPSFQEALNGSPTSPWTRQLWQDATEAQSALHFLEGRYKPALERLATLAEHVSAEGRLKRLTKVWIMQAVAHQAIHEQEEAHESFLKAIRQAATEGYVRTFLDEGQYVRRLALDALARKPMISRAEDRLLNELATGKVPLAAAFPACTEAPEPDVRLSPREQEVLSLLAHGYSNKEIANSVGLSDSTIKFYRKNLYRKLEVHSRSQAVAAAKSMSVI